MKRGIVLSFILSNLIFAEQNIGVINVESSTIKELDIDKKSEISTVNIISNQDIENIDPKNINDVLETIPGVTADVRSNGVVEIHLRGVNQQEFMWEDTGVAIVIDGVPVLQNGGKVSFNMDEIASIKVIKGSAAYLYGNNALAGAVIITTKRNRNKNGFDIKAEGGSESFKNIKFTGYKSNDKYAFEFLGSYRGDNGYWYKTKNWVKTLGGKFTYYIDDSSDVTFNADISKRYDETSRGSVTGVSQAQSNPKAIGVKAWNYDINTDVYKYYINYNKDFQSGSNLMINSYYYKDKYSYLSSPQDTPEGKVYTKTTDKIVKQYGIKKEYRGNYKDFAYMVGLDLGKRELIQTTTTTTNYSLSNRGRTSNYYKGEYVSSKNKENRYAIYSELKYKVNNKLSLVSNLRLDYDKYRYLAITHDYNDKEQKWINNTKSAEKSFTNTSFRIGATYKLFNDTTLFTNISSGFRNPTVDQLYAGDLKSSRYRIYKNNLDIKTQKSMTYEIGLRGKINSLLSYEASAFIIDTKDIIARSYGTYFSSKDATIYDNVGKSRNKGFELTLKSDSSKKLSFRVSYTYLNAYYRSHSPFYVALEDKDVKYDISGNQLPRVPHHKIDLQVTYKPTDKFILTGELYAQSNYYADETNLVKMGGYAKVNLKATYKPTKNLELFAKVDNLFNRHYYRTVYLFKDKNGDNILDAEDASITVDPGRVFRVGLKYKF